MSYIPPYVKYVSSTEGQLQKNNKFVLPNTLFKLSIRLCSIRM